MYRQNRGRRYFRLTRPRPPSPWGRWCRSRTGGQPRPHCPEWYRCDTEDNWHGLDGLAPFLNKLGNTCESIEAPAIIEKIINKNRQLASIFHKFIYWTRAIITCGLYIFYTLYEGQKHFCQHQNQNNTFLQCCSLYTQLKTSFCCSGKKFTYVLTNKF